MDNAQDQKPGRLASDALEHRGTTSRRHLPAGGVVSPRRWHATRPEGRPHPPPHPTPPAYLRSLSPRWTRGPSTTAASPADSPLRQRLGYISACSELTGYIYTSFFLKCFLNFLFLTHCHQNEARSLIRCRYALLRKTTRERQSNCLRTHTTPCLHPAARVTAKKHCPPPMSSSLHDKTWGCVAQEIF